MLGCIIKALFKNESTLILRYKQKLFMAGTKGRTIRKVIEGGGGGRAKYQKNIRARENEMKKIHVRQLTLKNIHAKA